MCVTEISYKENMRCVEGHIDGQIQWNVTESENGEEEDRKTAKGLKGRLKVLMREGERDGWRD